MDIADGGQEDVEPWGCRGDRRGEVLERAWGGVSEPIQRALFFLV